MITIINILVFSIFFLFVLNTNLRMTLQVANIRKVEVNIIFIIFLLGINAFFVSELFLTFNLFENVPWSKIIQSSLGVFATSSICFAVIAVMKEVTSKKLKTLLRLPLIGILCGVFFEPQQVLLGFAIIETLVCLALYKVREDYRYVFRQQFKSILGMIIFIIGVKLNISFIFIIGIFIFLLMKIQIINALKLKLLIREESYEE